MFQSVRNQLREYVRSPRGILLLIPLILMGAFVIKFQNGALEVVAGLGGGFIYQVFAMGLLILGAESAYSVSEFERSIMPPLQLWTARLVALFLLGCALFVVPLAVMLILWQITPVSTALWLNYLLGWLGTWVLQSLFFSAVGLVVGALVEGKGAYALAVLLSFLACPVVGYESAPAPLIQQVRKLLLLGFQNTDHDSYFGFGYSFGAEFWLRVLFYLLVAGALLCLLAARWESLERRRRTRLAQWITLGCAAVCLVGYCMQMPHTMLFHRNETISLTSEQRNNWREDRQPGIGKAAYQMQVDLEDPFQNDCTLTLTSAPGEQLPQELTLTLDRCFQVEQVQLNGQPVDHRREVDKLYLNLGEQASQSAQIRVIYHGSPTYWDFRECTPTVLCRDQQAFLWAEFAWYPRLMTQDPEQAYTLTVRAKNALASNLSGHQVLPRQEEYHLQGSAPGVYLLSGYFTNAQVGQYQVILPEVFAKRPGIEDKLQENAANYERLYQSGGEYSLSEGEELPPLTAWIYGPADYSNFGFSCFDGAFLDTDLDLEAPPEI